MRPPGGPAETEQPPPFPQSLCHACAAPPRYVTTDRGAVFIHCPILAGYPPQPVRACEHYRPRDQGRVGD